MILICCPFLYKNENDFINDAIIIGAGAVEFKMVLALFHNNGNFAV
jgi:hypothetical protein